MVSAEFVCFVDRTLYAGRGGPPRCPSDFVASIALSSHLDLLDQDTSSGRRYRKSRRSPTSLCA